MSKIKELYMEIEGLLVEGLTGSEIAERLGVDENLVYDVMDDLELTGMNEGETDDGWALASAGFGTDEDYGYYGEE